MRKTTLILSMLFATSISSYSNANMAEWFPDSSGSANTNMESSLNIFYGSGDSHKSTGANNTNRTSNPKNRTETELTKNTDVVENLEPRPQSGLMIAQRQRLKELGQQTEADIKNALTDEGMEVTQPVAPQPTIGISNSTPKPSTGASITATEREQMAEQQRMEQFISKSQQFLDSNTLSSLQGDQTIAISMLNSALMQLGVEAMSGLAASGNNPTYNQAIGCVNSFANQRLNQVSNSLISKYASIANIMPTVRSSPQIGSSYTNKCF